MVFCDIKAEVQRKLSSGSHEIKFDSAAECGDSVDSSEARHKSSVAAVAFALVHKAVLV